MERTFSKMGGAGKDNVQWYYIDKDNNYVGPVNTHKMRQLKKFEYVTPESYVWASHLSGWKTYATVPELADPKAGAKPGGKVGAPPSIGMAKAKPGVDQKRLSSAGAAPSMAGLSLEDEAPAPITAGRPDMIAAPDAADEWNQELGLRIVDEQRKIRAIIAPDGEVKDGSGKVLAYIEPTGDCGSPDMDFLGCAKHGQVLDSKDEPCGAFDQGRGNVSDVMGSCLCEINNEGVVKGNAQQTAGYVEGFTFDDMQTIAAYVLLVDRSFTAGY